MANIILVFNVDNDVTKEQLHEALCLAIYEENEVATAFLAAKVNDIAFEGEDTGLD